MITCDIVCCHPKDIFYPWFVWRMKKDRIRFNKVIIVMTQSGSDRDYTNEIPKYIPEVTIVKNYPYEGKDWRNDAVKEGLYEVRSDWVLFLEQDFLIKDGFFPALFRQAEGFNTAGFREGERFHPACLLTRMDVLARTNKDFSVDPDKGDHFVKVSRELDKIGNWVSLKDLTLPDYYHLSGLTQNFRLTENWHKENEFLEYIRSGLSLDQPISWWDFCVNLHPDKDYPDVSEIQKFFEGAYE